MINLIMNEFEKIFKKKGIYITLAIVASFIVLINVMMNYARNYTYSVYYDYDSFYDEAGGLSGLDPENIHELDEYLMLKTNMDMNDLLGKYGRDSWQAEVIHMRIYGYLHEINRYTYGYEKNEELLKEAKERYEEIIEKLDNDNWRYFTEEELKQARESLEMAKEQKEETTSKTMLKDIEKEISNLESNIETLELRLSADIKWGRDYLNDTIEQFRFSSNYIKQFEKKSDSEKEYEDELLYQTSLEGYAMSKYIIENKVDIYAINLRMLLMDAFSQYSLFIIILVVMISGSIVSEEFSKGTVKLWLVRPHGRMKMLLAKFITSMIMILIAMIIVATLQLIIGGIVFGFDSLNIPAVVYNFNTNELIEMSVFKYLIIQGVAMLPFYILMATIAFAISTIMTNTALAITIAMLGYIGDNIINMLVYQYNIKFMKFFITMNWHLEGYLYGRLPEAEYLSFGFSAVICAIYFVILVIPSFIIFKKKNIKNV